ncbi:adhesion G-protein coupled receptor G2-like [Calliphora vicina]|uniref:adhesion G-protein coupled receptor G2-like n=1 Tax=Calliphora vicina TaxID=7373 RepID=UPI00325BA099
MIHLIIFAVLLNTSKIFANEKCAKVAYNIIVSNGSQESRSLIIWYPANVGTRSKYEKCSKETGKPLERNCINESGKAKWLENNRSDKYVDCNMTVHKCDDEPFEHNYRNEDNKLKKYHTKWQSVSIGEVGYLSKPCYLSTGMLLMRNCKYNPTNYKAEWELLDEEKEIDFCWEEKLSELQQGEILKKSDKSQDNQRPVTLFTLTQDVTENKLYINNPSDATKRSPEHVKAINNILKTILAKCENPQLVPDIMNLTNTLMKTKADVIRESNCAGEIFSTIDSYLNNMAKLLVPTNKCESINNGIYMKTVPMASVFFINPLCSNISGVAIFNSNNSAGVQRIFDQHSNNFYHFIYLNQSLEQLLKEPNLKIATYFPFDLWYSIANTTGKLPRPLPFIFTHTMQKDKVKPDCGYWNFSTWITTGVNTSHITNKQNEQLLLCNTSHLTPFSAIFLDSLDDVGLDLISALGCGLSLFGLVCIWLTAACFPRWREDSTNKVLLNLCFVLTLLMVLFLLINMPEFKDAVLDMKNYVNCMIVGGFLQYIVLVLFMWMLFIAYLQYQRLAKIFKSEMPRNYIAKFFLIAWGLPLIPTGLVAYYQPNAYRPSAKSMEAKSAICYPSGYGFYLGVMLPMAVIIIANVSIFILIICKFLLSNMQFKSQRSRHDILRQIYVSIFLFFLLGISWIFGMLAHLESSPVFSYIFCLTSTLQGFVIFIYFIIINETTRQTWWNLICGINSSHSNSRMY